jgi:hypothetical protein
VRVCLFATEFKQKTCSLVSCKYTVVVVDFQSNA